MKAKLSTLRKIYKNTSIGHLEKEERKKILKDTNLFLYFYEDRVQKKVFETLGDNGMKINNISQKYGLNRNVAFRFFQICENYEEFENIIESENDEFRRFMIVGNSNTVNKTFDFFDIDSLEKFKKIYNSNFKYLLLSNNDKCKYFENFNKEDFKNIEYNDFFLEMCEKETNNILKNLENIDNQKQEKNIKEINLKQKEILVKNYNMEVDFDEKIRNLVLYFRDENMEIFDFLIITYFLNKYINGNYSKIFNNLKIVSRRKNLYPKEIHDFSDLRYLDVTGEDFRKSLTIFSNTVHFTLGRTIEEKFMKTTIPIIGLANFYDNGVNWRVPLEKNNFSKLNLKYGIVFGSYNNYSDFFNKSGGFSSIMKEILSGVQNCENKTLKL